MKKTNGFKKGSLKIATRLECGKRGLQEVSGYIMGDIGLDQRTKGNWRATHIPSGLAIGSFGYRYRKESSSRGKITRWQQLASTSRKRQRILNLLITKNLKPNQLRQNSKIITADAMHCQKDTAEKITSCLTVHICTGYPGL